MKKNVFVVLFLISSILHSQNSTKSIYALKIKIAPKINGILDEAFWDNADEAKNFVMFDPGDGTPENPLKKTIVKVAYDNEAIYVGAILFDDKPSTIPLQFKARDEFGQADHFVVAINPNNDGQNDTEFVVMSTGAQADIKVVNGKEDSSWNAVWESAVKINSSNWVVEIKIPYSELRFSNTLIQTWGINFFRKITALNEEYVWNYIDKKVGTFSQYAGNLKGIKNISPPTRLSFYPYTQSSVNNFENETTFDFSAGMDLKYGINESFTADLTLIPDFGQAGFDDQVLNLGPFEQHFSEKRAFFTEGTELFNLGHLFYSRRIGNTPVGYSDVEEHLAVNEEIIDNPDKVNMLNALKISGRTKNGLGIGFFNAITEKTEATVKNTSNNNTRKEVTEPLANYNLIVLDQQFNKNSSVTFVNSNVTRNGKFRDANVTGLLFDIADKQNKFNVKGNYKFSRIVENGTTSNGYAAFLKFAKTSGNYQYEIKNFRSNASYEINDFGFQRRNNLSKYEANVSYQIFEPTTHFNKFRISLDTSLDYQLKPNKYATNAAELRAFFITLNRFAFGAGIEKNFGPQNDFYEPRVEGRFFKQNAVTFYTGWISTDYRNKFAIDIRSGYGTRYKSANIYKTIKISPRYRFSDKFELIYSLNYTKMDNEKGYVETLTDDSIIFGNRDIKTLTNSVQSNLNFNTKSSLGLAFRHYWSPVKYDNSYYELNQNGTLNSSLYSKSNDINYNIWNLDLSYKWEFAPGSELVALYRNAIFNEDNLADLNFKDNITNLFKEPNSTNFSIKLVYYLDYNNIKNWL